MLSEHPPSYTQSHDPSTLNFPAVPIADLPSIHHERTLPPLPAVRPEPVAAAESPQFAWPSSNPLTAYYQPGPSQLSPKNKSAMNSPGGMDIDTPDSRGRRGGSVLSIDDPDVRIAAEALGDLRAGMENLHPSPTIRMPITNLIWTADFIQSPPQKHSSLPTTTSQSGTQPEPLLSLLTTSHPLIGTAIGGSLSAYSASKNYSPRFKSSAEYVERRFTPVVNTVGSVGRLTGVEGGVRWFLGGRRPSHHPPSDIESGVSNKRRKTGTDERDRDSDRNVQDPYRQELQHRQRRASQSSAVESLPAYDDEHCSPSYEQALIPTSSAQHEEPISPGGSSSWQSRLVLSTSGLSVAMSEESLRSLKFCLGWLRWANEHIGKVILALKQVLEQYDHGSEYSTSGVIEGNRTGWTYPNEKGGVQGNGQLVVRSDAERSALNAKIAELKNDVLKTLKEVVDIVSKYAGGALPENARVLVRKHLTSLPQRFRLASSATTNGSVNGERGDREVTEGANRVMVLAKEGLDMMAQVSGVLDGTIVSAEEWCERLGRKRREEVEFEFERGQGQGVGIGMGQGMNHMQMEVEVEKPDPFGPLPSMNVAGENGYFRDIKM